MLSKRRTVLSGATVPLAGGTMTGELVVPDLATSGLTGATVATRYVGGTAAGPPIAGTFAVGDFVITQVGSVWVCTVAGSPGTWVNAAAPLYAERASDSTPVNNSTVLVTSSVLTLPVKSGRTYLVEADIVYDAATAADLKANWSVPGSSSGWWTSNGLVGSAASSGASINRASAAWGTGQTIGGVGVGSQVVAHIRGKLTAGADGSIAFQYAQATADVSDLTIRTGSWVKLLPL